MRSKQQLTRSKNESFCEKSMKTVVNIIKLSSLSLAQISLMKTTTKQPPVPPSSTPLLIVPVYDHHHQQVVHPAAGSQLRYSSQEAPPETGLKQRSSSYLLDTYDDHQEKDSNYVISELGHGMIMNIDGRASDYIRRVHEKNRNDHTG